MTRLARCLGLSLTTLALLSGCAAEEEESAPYDFSSAEATLLDFEFDGQFIADSAYNPQRLIEDQMLYTIGHLNGDRAVGRLDKLVISDVVKTELEDGKTQVTYHAKMPVGWASKTNLPTSYTFTLPLHVDYDDYERFTEQYSHSCVDWGAHDVDSGSMWYYFRPNRSGCNLEEADVFKTVATVSVSPDNTEGKYPEYHKVWEDNVLDIVAIFGKYEDGATSGDAGISAYNTFVKEIKRELGAYEVTTDPAEIPSSPGVDVPDITFRASLPDGRSVEVVALLVDNVRTAGATFNKRYEALSGDADMIAYNGHAGLGANIRALASKGKFLAGQYQIFFMNGCDTFAYVDEQLLEAHAVLNDDDPIGTRYVDMVTNVMPSFFSSMPHASMALIEGLLSYDAPKTYDEIFKLIDKSEVVVVTGEEDNVYEPGYQPGGNGWEGLDEQGSVTKGESKHYELGELPAGTYSINLSHDPAAPGGDVDLYVSLGGAPSLETYDFRPYLNGSDEAVTVSLEQPTKVFVMVHGYEYADQETMAYLLSAKSE